MTSMPQPPRPLALSDCLLPDWAAMPRVRALLTTRAGGVSLPPYHGRTPADGGLNLGPHTGDDPAAVVANRARLTALTGVRLTWLEQVHGADVVDAAEVPEDGPARADASVTAEAGVACVVMTADCLPVLFADRRGRAVGAAHAGWRGLAAGVLEATAARVAALAGGDAELLAFLGPAIGARAFEVGGDVHAAFVDAAPAAERDATAAAFAVRAAAPGKYCADLAALARLRLARAGIRAVGGGTHCTFEEPARFYSHRRDRVTGRGAALVWLVDGH